MFPHRVETQHGIPFFQISTSGGHKLFLSSKHYLPFFTIPISIALNQHNTTQKPTLTTTLVTAQSVKHIMWIDTIYYVH